MYTVLIAESVGMDTALVERQTELAALRRNAVFAVIENCDTERCFRNIRIFMIYNLKLCLFDRCIPCGTLDIAELYFMAGKSSQTVVSKKVLRNL